MSEAQMSMTVRVCPLCDIADCAKHRPKEGAAMTDITIPPEAVEAAARADYEMTRDEALSDHGIMASLTYCPWEDLSVDGKEYYMKHATAALRAGIAAWPGVEADRILRARNDGSAVAEPRIVLPLPQDTRDE